MWKYLIQGFLIGIAYVAPIGTQNMFVINTALTQKRSRTIITSMIVAFFDISLSLACFYGVGAIMERSVWLELTVMGIGSLVVIWMGISILRSHDTMQSEDVDIPYLKIISIACVVTWFNPQALIDGTMLLGASRASVPDPFGTAFIIGAALASFVWWLFMPLFVGLFRAKINDKVLRIINVICGSFIVFYGCKLLYNGIQIAVNLAR